MQVNRLTWTQSGKQKGEVMNPKDRHIISKEAEISTEWKTKEGKIRRMTDNRSLELNHELNRNYRNAWEQNIIWTYVLFIGFKNVWIKSNGFLKYIYYITDLFPLR